MDGAVFLTDIQLRRYNGDRMPMYVAYQGIIYDLTNCPHWRTGLHEGQHFPGQELTAEFLDAPHGEEVFKHPCAKVVGKLINS